MRTTVTIEPDTEALLKEEIQRTGMSFKECLNTAIRKALGNTERRDLAIEPLFRAPFPSTLANANFNRFADELDDEETLRELGA
jgi:hypothetical protein